MGRSRICSPRAVEGPLIWVQPQDRLFLHLSQRWDWTRSIGCSLPPSCACPKERHVVGLYILPTARGRHELPVATNINVYVWLRIKESNVEPQPLTFAQASHAVLCFRHTQHVTLFVCKQAAAAPIISAKVQFTGCNDDLHQSSGPFSSLDSSENDDHSAQPAADIQCPEVATISCCYMMVVQWLMLQLLKKITIAAESSSDHHALAHLDACTASLACASDPIHQHPSCVHLL